jgi:hypothetical protein
MTNLHNFERRVRRLELRAFRSAILNPSLIVVNSVAPGSGLPYGARVVIDRFRETETVVFGMERITIDPLDTGRQCAKRGYLDDVLRTFHQDCHWSRSGMCRLCVGTAVASSTGAEQRKVREA